MSQVQKTPNSRNIPLPIQREVRQRCGFGCVICGIPLYEYDHIKNWADVKEHVPNDITLLCDKHHKEKTNGLLPLEDVIKANENPYNLQGDVSKPYDMHFSGDKAEVIIGGNRFTCEYQGYGTILIPLSVDDDALIGFILGDDHLLLNLAVFDENNNLVLHIKNNQLYSSTAPWDIQLAGTTLTIREAQRKILVEIIFEPPNRVIINKGRLLRNGVEILIRPKNILITNNAFLLKDMTAENVSGGIIIGPHKNNYPCCFRINNISRYLGDKTEALKWEKESLELIK